MGTGIVFSVLVLDFYWQFEYLRPFIFHFGHRGHKIFKERIDKTLF
jgi:hypothetical protein